MNIFNKYRKLESSILNIIAAEFFIQLINNAFLVILLIYMEKELYQDYESASFIAYRFFAVLLFAFPVGLFIKGKKLKPFFYTAAIITPTFSLLILHGVDHHINWLINTSLFMWGIGFMLMRSTVIPFILRNSKSDSHIEGISLSYSTWSFAGVIAGMLIYFFAKLNPNLFDEKLILQIISVIGYLSILFVARSGKKEIVPEKSSLDFKSYDWLIIAKALFPTVIIATGAGFSIPFAGLFFYKIHGIESYDFGLITTITTIIVFLCVLSVPKIKEKWGYKKAIPLTQSAGVIALTIMATTEWYNTYSFAFIIAIVFYVFRQPLMQMASPMTSDLTMKFVGSKNQEMISALTAAIWSGSLFISSKIFQMLRESGMPYVNIFLITTVFYIVGIIAFYMLIVAYEKREKAELPKIGSKALNMK